MDNCAAKNQRFFKSFKRLFPQFNPTKIAKPARSELMATMHNIIQYAFDAYEEPKINGFMEQTPSGAEVRHLN